MPLYLIHFDRRHKHAGHYLGCTTNLLARLEAHRSGRGARLLAVIQQEGISWQVARVWEDGDFALEQRLKRWKSGPRLCPICKAQASKKPQESKKPVSTIPSL